MSFRWCSYLVYVGFGCMSPLGLLLTAPAYMWGFMELKGVIKLISKRCLHGHRCWVDRLGGLRSIWAELCLRFVFLGQLLIRMEVSGVDKIWEGKGGGR